MKHFVLRLIMVMAGMLIGHSASAAPVVCSWGYQDSTCLVPLRGSGPAAPTCSGQGVTTVTPAVWQGSHWSQPTCQTQAPPTCSAGTYQTSAPVWNGSSWSAPGCAVIPNPPPPPPPNPAAICAGAMGGNVRAGGNGTSIRTVAGSTFAQYTGFIPVPYNQNIGHTWSYPQYAIVDPYPLIDISNAVGWLGLPTTAETADSWYGATFTGPTYADVQSVNTYNGYFGMCGVDASGNLVGVMLVPDYPQSYDAN